MAKSNRYLALDIGEKRIGVAWADDIVRLASPVCTLTVDGTEYDVLAQLADQYDTTHLIIGYPRNQSGDPTQQTHYVESIAAALQERGYHITFQDESLTSVIAEQRLQARKKPYQKSDIDSEAAAIILQDYLESK